MKAFFGDDGKRALDLSKFARFLHALHDEVRALLLIFEADRKLVLVADCLECAGHPPGVLPLCWL